MNDNDHGLETGIDGHSPKTGKSGTRRKTGEAKADKALAELGHYRTRLASNEERLRSGQAVDGTPLSDLQRRNLEEVIARQRARLLELSS